MTRCDKLSHMNHRTRHRSLVRLTRVQLSSLFAFSFVFIFITLFFCDSVCTWNFVIIIFADFLLCFCVARHSKSKRVVGKRRTPLADAKWTDSSHTRSDVNCMPCIELALLPFTHKGLCRTDRIEDDRMRLAKRERDRDEMTQERRQVSKCRLVSCVNWKSVQSKSLWRRRSIALQLLNIFQVDELQTEVNQMAVDKSNCRFEYFQSLHLVCCLSTKLLFQS